VRVFAYATLIVLPLILRGYYSWLLELSLIYATLSISWAILENEGRVSMGHSFLVGLSAYSSALTTVLFDSPVLGLLISIPASTLILYGLKRITGKTSFVFATFTISLFLFVVSPYIVVNGSGGEEGFFLPTLGEPVTTVLTLSIFAFSVALYELFDRSKYGYFARAIKSDETSSRAIGIEVERVKILTSFLSSLIASLSGFNFALFFSHVSPELSSVEMSIFPFIAFILTGGKKELIAFTSVALYVFSTYLNGVASGLHLLLFAAILILSPKIGGWIYAKSSKRIEGQR